MAIVCEILTCITLAVLKQYAIVTDEQKDRHRPKLTSYTEHQLTTMGTARRCLLPIRRLRCVHSCTPFAINRRQSSSTVAYVDLAHSPVLLGAVNTRPTTVAVYITLPMVGVLWPNYLSL